jgi:hypothetical protein
MPTCTFCDSTGWVCEVHPYLPWGGRRNGGMLAIAGVRARRVRDVIRVGIANTHRGYRRVIGR